MTEQRLTSTQRAALETIRSTPVSCAQQKTRDVPTAMSGCFHRISRSRNKYRADFDIRTIRALEKRGLVEVVDVVDDDFRTRFGVRITDAGRVPLGDWAAGDRRPRLRVAR